MGTSGRGCCFSLRFNLLDLNISRAVSAESPKDENESLVLATATDVLETQVVFGVDGRKNDGRFGKADFSDVAQDESMGSQNFFRDSAVAARDPFRFVFFVSHVRASFSVLVVTAAFVALFLFFSRRPFADFTRA